MIEMSVDKEMVLPGNGREDPALHMQTQQHMLEHTGSSDRKAEAAGALVAMSVSSEGSTGGDLLGSGSLVQQQTLHVTLNTGCSRTESVGLEARIGGHNFLPRNGVHQPLQQQKQPSQQQKLNKRRYSMNVGFKHPGFSKRRRRANSESDPVLPTNFLMGGNIFDPLNLNSLLDEEVNQALNAETPKSSPLPAKNRDPVEILIPKDITDPLNLSGGGGILVSPMKSGGRKRHRNRHHGGGGGGGGVIPPAQPDGSESEAGKASEGCTAETGGVFVPLLSASSDGAGVVPEGPFPLNLIPVPESPRPYELNTSINCRDEVVPPLLPSSHLHTAPSAVLKSQLHGPGDSGSLALCHSSSRNRKRRRTFSKSESLPATPATLAKRGSVERGPALRAGKHSQTFHTPVGGGVTGHLPAVSRCGQQRPQNRRRERKFQYGNYNKYYGYRNPGLSEDPRVRVLRSEWFRGKAVLDLGCNTGHLTLTIAKNWHPSRILGLDIDGRLVHAAQQNVRHYLSELHVQEAWQARREMQKEDRMEQSEGERESGGQGKEKPKVDTNGKHLPPGLSEDKGAGMESNIKVGEGTVSPKKLGSRFFPISFRVCRGPIAAPPLFALPPGDFPANVSFIKGNYVLESDALLQTQQPEYDVILCLSVTKWVHLNWGDGGLQRLFKRAFRHLHPGGVFILEPQPWSSYGRRKKLTDTTYKNYYKIRLKPDQFTSYLTSEVGFSSYELIGTPKTTSRGFQRPIYLFHKGPSSRK